MICKKCGEEIEHGLMYCPKCGESIQLVPDYDVFEEELLSKVVEDKRKAKDDKFAASGVYQNADKNDAQPTETEVTSKKAPVSEPQVFTKKIKILLFVGSVIVVIIGICLMIPYMGTHSYDSLMNMAIDAEKDSQYAKALGYYESAYEQDLTSFEAAYGMGRMYCKVKDYDSAITYLNKALELDDTNNNVYIYLIEAYDGIGDTASISALAKDIDSPEIIELISSYIMLPPSFNIEPGEYQEDQIIQLSTEGDYQIFYTVNGKNPTTSGKLYTKPIMLSEGSTVIKAVTQNKSGEYSEVVSGEYVIKYKELATPVVTPASGTYNNGFEITIDVPEGCRAYYTLDGTNPSSSNGIQYIDPIPFMEEGGAVLSVVIIDEKGNTSPIYKGSYIYQK
jgi:tetratricopeptide (TPR) repeat protein